MVRSVAALAGGPVGRYARIGERRFWTALRVLAALAVLMGVLGWAEKSTCRVHPYSHEYQYTRMCYTDVFVLYNTEGLAGGQRPYLDHPVEYPVLIGAVMYGVAEIDRAFPVPSRERHFFDLTALLLAAALVATVLLTALTHRRRPWDAALIALAPAVLLNMDVNWDLVAVALTAGAILAWSRRHPAWAGVLLGLGTATKLYPLLLLWPLLFLCLRARRMRAFGGLLAGAITSWAVVDVPVWVANPRGFAYFYSFSEHRTTEFNSLWWALDYAWSGGRKLVSSGTMNLVSSLVYGVSLVAIAGLVLAAPRRPRLPQVAFLTVAMFVLTGKVYSPQYVLWLVPLAALARPRWRYFLAWQLSEVVLFITLYGYLINYDTSGGKGVPYPAFFLLGVLPRDLTLLGLVGLVVREVLRPARDVIRASGDDDPAGGVLDGCADPPVLRRRIPRPPARDLEPAPA
ncbi:MAG: glycosyltransferase family 87 protein [Mycobacteriales bacterium]